MTRPISVSGVHVLAGLGVDPENLPLDISAQQLDGFIAAVNWLTDYRPAPTAAPLAQVRGCVEAFYALCAVGAWEVASRLISTPLQPNTDFSLCEQLGVWGYQHELCALYSQLLGKVNGEIDARCLQALGCYHPTAAVGAEYCRRSVALFQAYGQEREAAWTLFSLGLREADRAHNEQASLHYQEALQRFRKLGDLKGVAKALQNLACMETNLGNYADARRLFEESLQIHVVQLKLADQQGCMWLYHTFGWFLLELGDLAAARVYLRQSLRLARQLADGSAIPWALHRLGRLMYYLGKPGLAALCLRQAMKLFREFDNLSGIAWNNCWLGRSAIIQRDCLFARQCYQEQTEIHQSERNTHGLICAVEGFAYLAIAQGQMADGAHLLGAAEALRKQQKFPLVPVERAERASRIALARTGLGNDAFTEAWQVGQTRSLEQAVFAALRSSR